MPRPKKPERALGPYLDARTGEWYLVVTGGGGPRSCPRFSTEEKARAVLLATNRDLTRKAETTIEEGIGLYLEYLTARGDRPVSVDTARYRLRSFFPDRDIPLASLSSAKCEVLYDALTRRQRPDTQQSALGHAQRLLSWLVKRGQIKQNCAADIEPRGQKTYGKEQLRVEEARRFAAKAEARYLEEGDRGALVCLVALVLALRATEIAGLTARDVDDEGRLLWVGGTKSRAARRRLLVPDRLAPLLVRAAKGLASTALLFGDHGSEPRHWVRMQVARICDLSLCPDVTTHSLRGLHATMAEASGASAEAVAQTLGHASSATTHASYTQPQSLEATRTARALAVLEGGKK